MIKITFTKYTSLPGPPKCDKFTKFLRNHPELQNHNMLADNDIYVLKKNQIYRLIAFHFFVVVVGWGWFFLLKKQKTNPSWHFENNYTNSLQSFCIFGWQWNFSHFDLKNYSYHSIRSFLRYEDIKYYSSQALVWDFDSWDFQRTGTKKNAKVYISCSRLHRLLFMYKICRFLWLKFEFPINFFLLDRFTWYLWRI